jgi:AmiR/NasT family two-component response regulator
MQFRPTVAAKPRILVIDHDAQRSAGLCRLLTGDGFQLVEAMAETTQPVDLVIAAIARGRCHRAIAAEIARFRGRPPVLALIDHAAWIGFDFFDVADALGAAAVLQRPFPRAALLRSIAAVLSQVPAAKMAENSWIGLQSESAEFLLEDSHFA